MKELHPLYVEADLFTQSRQYARRKEVDTLIRQMCVGMVAEESIKVGLGMTFKNRALMFASFLTLRRCLSSYKWQDECRERFRN